MKQDPGWHNVNIGLVFSVIMAIIARHMQITFGGPEAIQFVPSGPEDFPKARKAERLIDIQFAEARTPLHTTRFLMHAHMYGVGHARYGWNKQYGPVQRDNWTTYGRLRPFSGGPTRLRADRPEVRPIDPADAFPYPGYQDIDEMPGFAHRWYGDAAMVRARMRQGPNGEPPSWDYEACTELLRSNPRAVIAEERQNRRSFASGTSEDKTWGAVGSLHQPCEFLDVFVVVPEEYGLWYDQETGQVSETEFYGATFETDLMLTIADRTHLLCAVPIQTPGGVRPILVHRPHEDPHHYHAPGKIEVIAKLQAAANRMINNELDAREIAIQPPWIANINAVDPRAIRTGPRGITWTDRPTSDQDLRQVALDLRGMQLNPQFLGYVWGLMQQTSGVVGDTGMGAAISKRQSATEFSGRSDAMNVRLALETMLFEIQYLQPAAQAFWQLDRQFLDVPMLVRGIGGNALFDPVLGRFQAPELDVITEYDLAWDADIRAVGATKQISQFAQQQGLSQITPFLMPFMQAGILQPIPYLRQLLPVFNIRNVEEMLGSQDPVTKAVTQLLLQYGQGGLPVGGASGTAAPQGQQMDPRQLLEQVMNEPASVPGAEEAYAE